MRLNADLSTFDETYTHQRKEPSYDGYQQHQQRYGQCTHPG